MNYPFLLSPSCVQKDNLWHMLSAKNFMSPATNTYMSASNTNNLLEGMNDFLTSKVDTLTFNPQEIGTLANNIVKKTGILRNGRWIMGPNRWLTADRAETDPQLKKSERSYQRQLKNNGCFGVHCKAFRINTQSGSGLEMWMTYPRLRKQMRPSTDLFVPLCSHSLSMKTFTNHLSSKDLADAAKLLGPNSICLSQPCSAAILIN